MRETEFSVSVEDTVGFVKPDSLAVLKRAVDRGYRHFCRQRGLPVLTFRDSAHAEVLIQKGKKCKQ